MFKTFVFENRAVYDILRKNIVQTDSIKLEIIFSQTQQSYGMLFVN